MRAIPPDGVTIRVLVPLEVMLVCVELPEWIKIGCLVCKKKKKKGSEKQLNIYKSIKDNLLCHIQKN